MPNILASELIDKAAAQLFDINGAMWNRTELLGWLNDGQRQITLTIPESTNLLRVSVQMTSGTEQSIPADGWMLMDIYRNMGSDGQTPGRAVRLVDRKTLEGFNPDWHSDPQTAAVTNWIFDPQSATQFWVYPPSDGTGWVEINYSQVPADLAAETLPISINSIFETPLIDYIMYRACSKQVSYAPGLDKARAYWDAFTMGLAAKSKAEITNDPNQTLGRPPPDEAGVPR